MDGKGISRSGHAMNTITRSMYGWNTLPWPRIQRQVFKLQKRIYRATRRHDVRTVRKLQRLVLHAWSARLLAVRQVAQDNRGNGPQAWMGSKLYPPPTPRPGTIPHPRWHHAPCPPRLAPDARFDGPKTIGHADHG